PTRLNGRVGNITHANLRTDIEMAVAKSLIIVASKICSQLWHDRPLWRYLTCGRDSGMQIATRRQYKLRCLQRYTAAANKVVIIPTPQRVDVCRYWQLSFPMVTDSPKGGEGARCGKIGSIEKGQEKRSWSVRWKTGSVENGNRSVPY